jgi:AraC family transcriptional regulator
VVERYQLESNEVRDRTLDFYSVDVNLSRSFNLEWLCNGSFRQTLMVPDALCIMPAQQPLTMRWRDPLQVLSVKLEPSLLLSTARDLGMRATPEVPERHGDTDTQIAHISRALLAEQQAGYPTGRVFGESLGSALAACLLQRYAVRPLAAPVGGGLSPRHWKQVREFIEANLERDIGLHDMAAVTGLSPYHFSRCFKATSGTSPHQYLIARRVERARRLLTRAECSLAQIASRCGFADQSHLTRHMKRLLGVTPASLLPARHIPRKNLP